jgi:DNA topoisomerase-1
MRGGFRYVDPAGRPVRDLETLQRIRGLAIPPAWTDVWICPDARGHLQAIGRDAKGRKQYRYHPRWRQVRDETKYARLAAFARALPRVRRRVARDLGLRGLPRDKVLATVVRLLETTAIRVGNQEYARTNGSYGLTTLRTRHVKVEGSSLSFEFRGKSGQHRRVGLADRRLARVIRRCQDLPGYELFQYLDEGGQRQTIDSSDVNGYLRRIAGNEFTTKDFRTWAGTVLAAQELGRLKTGPRGLGRRLVADAIKRVAAQLGNTPAICRRCYVHPAVIDIYTNGDLSARILDADGRRHAVPRGLPAHEAQVLAVLERTARLKPARPRSA